MRHRKDEGVRWTDAAVFAAVLCVAPVFSRAVTIPVGNVTYEDFQPLNSSSPAPSGGAGTTSPLDATWNYTADPYSTTHIPNPSNTDLLQTTGATLSLAAGTLHAISLPVSALADGLLARNSDDPGNPGGRVVFSSGGPWRLLVSFPGLQAVDQVNSYSWHSNTRTIQQYSLYWSSLLTPPPVAGPGVDPGWNLIASPNSVVLDAEQTGAGSYDENSKHGVSISVGLPVRYLLFTFSSTNGDTFYTEIDVVPEPGTLALALAGGLVLLRRRGLMGSNARVGK